MSYEFGSPGRALSLFFPIICSPNVRGTVITMKFLFWLGSKTQGLAVHLGFLACLSNIVPLLRARWRPHSASIRFHSIVASSEACATNSSLPSALIPQSGSANHAPVADSFLSQNDHGAATLTGHSWRRRSLIPCRSCRVTASSWNSATKAWARFTKRSSKNPASPMPSR